VTVLAVMNSGISGESADRFSEVKFDRYPAEIPPVVEDAAQWRKSTLNPIPEAGAMRSGGWWDACACW